MCCAHRRGREHRPRPSEITTISSVQYFASALPVRPHLKKKKKKKKKKLHKESLMAKFEVYEYYRESALACNSISLAKEQLQSSSVQPAV